MLGPRRTIGKYRDRPRRFAGNVTGAAHRISFPKGNGSPSGLSVAFPAGIAALSTGNATFIAGNESFPAGNEAFPTVNEAYRGMRKTMRPLFVSQLGLRLAFCRGKEAFPAGNAGRRGREEPFPIAPGSFPRGNGSFPGSWPIRSGLASSGTPRRGPQLGREATWVH